MWTARTHHPERVPCGKVQRWAEMCCLDLKESWVGVVGRMRAHEIKAAGSGPLMKDLALL